MKLRNKRTGEIADTLCSYDITKGISLGIDHHDGNPTMACYNSLAELNDEWEDMPEEPKSGVEDIRLNDMISGRHIVEIDFTKVEEAKEAVEKLKAWKRLKNRGFRFDGYNACSVDYDIDEQYRKYISEDLDLLFGGEE